MVYKKSLHSAFSGINKILCNSLKATNKLLLDSTLAVNTEAGPLSPFSHISWLDVYFVWHYSPFAFTTANEFALISELVAMSILGFVVL